MHYPVAVRVRLTERAERELKSLPHWDRGPVKARLKGLPEDPWLKARRKRIPKAAPRKDSKDAPPPEKRRYLVELGDDPSTFFIAVKHVDPYYAIVRIVERGAITEFVVETICTRAGLAEEERKLIAPVKHLE
jgi:mRNA-degrading endonuclease RelE of RelBE toxin-antitoxin system